MPFFSIAIPTRNRSQTLKAAIATCLNQTFQDFELVISDNCSTDDTREIVSSFNDDRIKYIRASQPLAMSDNWDFALSECCGEYVSVIGDDDGLLQHALHDAYAILKDRTLPILRSQPVHYFWPSVPHYTPNSMSARLLWDNKIIQSRRMLQRVAGGAAVFKELPMIYYGFVHNTVISTMRSVTGRVFCELSPDLYSGIVIGYLHDSFAMLGRPLFIYGTSKFSNGLAVHAGKLGNTIAKEFFDLNREAELSWESKIPNLGLSASTMLNSFVVAKRLYFPNDKSLVPDYKTAIRRCIDEMHDRAASAAELKDMHDRLLGALAGQPDLQQLATTLIKQVTYNGADLDKPRSTFGLRRGRLFIDCNNFDVDGVDGAALLFEKLFNCMDSPVDIAFPDVGKQGLLHSIAGRIRRAGKVLVGGG